MSTAPTAPSASHPAPVTQVSRTRRRALAVVGGAAAGTVVHVVALAAGADMAVPAFDGDGTQQIAAVGVALSALVAVSLGWGVAVAAERWAPRPRATWLTFALAGLTLSFVPIAAIEATTTTRAALALEHVAVAAIAIPVLARTLPARRSR